MPHSSKKTFNLPWHQHKHYWISFYAPGEEFPPQLLAALRQAGMGGMEDGSMAIRTPRDWKAVWEPLYATIAPLEGLDGMEVALSIGDVPPEGQIQHRQSPADIQAIADSLWLGDALTEERILCYLQPVVSGRDKIFGYESFARVKAEGGAIIGGSAIIEAARALNIEHMIDRHLQVQAIKTFIHSKFDGFLFINFLPGFIHRPSVYLEGLSESVHHYGIPARHVVLEFTKSETPHDIEHLKSVCEYGRSRGYSIALDDIESVAAARKLVPEIRPDFVKLDMELARRASERTKREIIREIVDVTHAAAGSAIGEGVETEEMHRQLAELGVDLFQGYLFSPPMAVEAA